MRVGCDITIAIRYIMEAIMLSEKVKDPDLESSRFAKAGNNAMAQKPAATDHEYRTQFRTHFGTEFAKFLATSASATLETWLYKDDPVKGFDPRPRVSYVLTPLDARDI